MLRLSNSRVDTKHLTTLTTRRAELLARTQVLQTELDEITKAAETCQALVKEYQESHTALLEASKKEVVAQNQATVSQHQNRQRQLARVQQQGKSASNAEKDDAQELEIVARKRIEMGQAALVRIDLELQAAARGVYLKQEMPQLLQRSEELALKIPLLKANLTETETLLEVVEQELYREQERIRQLTVAVVTSPVSGVVWTTHGNQGQPVKENETLFEIADSSTIFVEVLLPQRYLASVGPGSRATILLTGGQTFAGRVQGVRTPGPVDKEASVALKLATHDLKQVRVIVKFDSDVDAGLIGRHVRVLLTDEEPTAIQSGMMWLFANLGGSS